MPVTIKLREGIARYFLDRAEREDESLSAIGLELIELGLEAKGVKVE
jgi:hypothetical protein